MNSTKSSVDFNANHKPVRLTLEVSGEETVAQFSKTLTGYLNTRPDAPKWLFELADQIDPVRATT